MRFSIIITIIFIFVEIIGGLLSRSISLLSDAGHMARDSFSLIITYIAIRLVTTPPHEKRTFGFHRIEVLSAIINGSLLFVYSGFMIKEGITRIINETIIEPNMMITIGSIGLIVNIIVFLKLHGSHDLNIKSAFLHVIGDLLSSIGVVIGSIFIRFTGINIIDPIIGISISLFLLISSSFLIKEGMSIMLQFTPTGVNVNDIIKDINEIKGIIDIHNVHLWALCSNISIFDAHILTDIKDTKEIEKMKKEIKEVLKNHNIFYSTLEIEWEKCDMNNKIEKIKHKGY